LATHGDDSVSPVNSYTENADFWVKIIRENMDRYRSDLTDPAVLQAVGNIQGLRVLDAGCGEGYLSRILARQGANVTGLDACAELVDAAREEAQREGLTIDHVTADVAAIPIESASLDLVVVNHVVTDLKDPEQPFREFGRVLKPGGRIVIMMLHPCFYSAQAERKALRGYAEPTHYFSVRVVEQEFNVAGITSPAKVTMWFRPLETYMDLLTQNGFVITTLNEPHPGPQVLAEDPWWHDNFVRPLFLLVTAERR